MLGIYKKLPRTNCGDCREPTCLGFAARVKNGQRSLSECPHIRVPGGELTAAMATAGSLDPYERVASQMAAQVQAMDFQAAAAATGGEWTTAAGVETIRLAMLNQHVDLRKDGAFVGDRCCDDVWDRMVLYDYVRRQGAGPAATDWATIEAFPRTPSHVKTFGKTAERQLAAAYAQDAPGLKVRLVALGGAEILGQVKADYSCRLVLLPHILMFLEFWAADEEFPASCKLFINSNANTFLDMEFLGHLLEKAVARALGKAEHRSA